MSIIESLDNYYNSRKSTDSYIMVILVAVLIGYLLYTLLSNISSQYREKEERRYESIKSNINSADTYLKTIKVDGDRELYIKKLDKKIIEKRVELNGYRDKVRKLDSAVSKLGGIVYNKDSWSEFIHNISLKANNNELKIDSISNVAYENNSSFGKVLDVNIKCKGKYGDILSFMNELERSDLVSNISYTKIKASGKLPVADINLTVWGVRE